MLGLLIKLWKKWQLKKDIRELGIEFVTKRAAKKIAKKLPTKDVAFQFVYQVLQPIYRNNEAGSEVFEDLFLNPEYISTRLENFPELNNEGGPLDQLNKICS